MSNLHKIFTEAQRSITPETIAEAQACVDRAHAEAERKIAAMNARLESTHHADKPLHKHWQIVLAVAMIVGAFAGFVWIAYKIPMQ